MQQVNKPNNEQLEAENSSQEKKNRIKKEIWEWFKALAIALVAALIVTQLIVVNAEIPSESMEKTIMTGDHVLGNRLAFLFKDPQRGDILIFKFPDDESMLFVKRAIGMPGETIEVKMGLVYINGESQPLEESYVNGVPIGDFGPVTVPEDSYFMLGDNRNMSLDSRYWKNTFVHKDKIVARASLRMFPNPTLLK